MNDFKNTINLEKGTVKEKREEIKSYFLKTYELYEKLFKLLKNRDSIYEQPNKLRHPLIFYYGHTATFFINKLIVSKIIDKRVNENFEAIFSVGVDEMSWDDLNDQNYTWPTFEALQTYRDEVKKVVLGVINTLDFSMPINWDSPMWIILMGIEHENIHLETSSVLLRQLEFSHLKKEQIFVQCEQYSKNYPNNELLEVKAGEVNLYKSRKNPIYYGWDNEFSNHKAKVKEFYSSKYLVSNGEFLEFIKDGGYLKHKYFSEEGVKWLNFTKTKLPIFWIKKENKYYLRQINNIIPLPLNYPVDVNFYEAEAFCKYKSEKLGVEIRLPSEDEYYRLYDYVNAQKKEGNIALRYFNQTPVNKYKFDDFYDVIGNVWQWTLTPIYAFDGFETHLVYDDFTTPTFDKQHNLIKGGSFISLGNERLKNSRYAFRKHFFQHAGFRYIKSNNEYEIKTNNNIYETNELVSQYCEFHYGETFFGVKNFLQKAMELLKPYIKNIKTNKALDLGCSVGRGSFELAKIFDKVLGVDFSANFIDIGIKLKKYDNIVFKLRNEGEIFNDKKVSLSDLGLNEVKNKVEFIQGDACNLKLLYSNYDLIFCSNLIDRLYDPQKFLDDIPNRVNKGGLLVIVSPYTWLEEYTPKKNWLGGFYKNGKEIKTLDTLKANLQNRFELVGLFELPFIIKETSRKFQHTVSQMSIWKSI